MKDDTILAKQSIMRKAKGVHLDLSLCGWSKENPDSIGLQQTRNVSQSQAIYPPGN